jgi:hypothetical protein
MVHIYYHIYAFKNAFEIVKEQINYIQNSFKSKIKVNIVITTPDRLGRISMNDCSSEIYDWLSKEILPPNENYVIRDYIISEEIRPTEWATLDFIIKDRELFSKDDFILYLHTKGASHEYTHIDVDINNLNRDDSDRFNYEKHRINYEKNTINWKRTMEYYLIEKNEECIDILKSGEYNTIGTFLNEPMITNIETYAGNYFWMTSDYTKTLLTNPRESEIDKNDRSTAESNFINTGINWKPYSMFNIPWDKFGTEQFDNLLKKIKNEN